MLQITKTGVRKTLTNSSPFKENLKENNYIKLKNFIDAELLSVVQNEIRKSEFRYRKHTNIGSELCMVPSPMLGALHFWVNNRTVLESVGNLLDVKVERFLGRVYKLTSKKGHYDSWHTDCNGSRCIGMSVNLSFNAYTGGVLQIRQSDTKNIIARVVNSGQGDAILFRISDLLEHRVTTVTGDMPRLAFAGWFCL